MAGHQVEATWMWHPSFIENDTETAGRFVHFRKELFIYSKDELPTSLPVHITADTRYKLYVNRQHVASGPVKGDANLWFYDEIDIAPSLKVGRNHIGVHVLRYFHATAYATSFPRLPTGGLRIQLVDTTQPLCASIQSSTSWETTIDHALKLRIDEPEDDFLHVYEHGTVSSQKRLQWVPAEVLEFQASTGQSAPWILAPRMIPFQKIQQACFSGMHNLKSCVASNAWSAALLRCSNDETPGHTSALSGPAALILPAGSKHEVDLEAAYHMTAFIELHFKRSGSTGSTVALTYAESYETAPTLVPYLRHKAHRQDYSKELFGPRDIYQLSGGKCMDDFEYHDAEDIEAIKPFHFRTFRFIRLQVDVGDSDLVLDKVVLQETNYPLDVIATVNTESDLEVKPLWETSIRTLRNCMHDCYEDCPFYEQLQYAMDTRSSILFTYYVSGDDRLPRQAIIQLRNSFVARLGLTASRAPSHKLQIIPHFSLYWISMVCDHWLYNGDRAFVMQFLPTIDAILNYFDNHLDSDLKLVRCDDRPGIWNYHDWTEHWRPYGIPPSVTKTGISTYTNCLYAYSLKNAASLLRSVHRPAVASEYCERADLVTGAINQHCFDGTFFTDSLAEATQCGKYHSQHNQAWAVLCGAAKGDLAARVLRDSLDTKRGNFIATSVSMSFYVLRALAVAGTNTYNEHFHRFWDPWRSQLALGLTTWEEDTVSQRSDCHAWGSAPIFEFLAEVAGIGPAEPGWAAINFEPRITLYREFEAKIPLPMQEGRSLGHVSIAWAPTVTQDVEVSLSAMVNTGTNVPIYVKLPSQPVQVVESGRDHVFNIQRKDTLNILCKRSDLSSDTLLQSLD
jgi:hypothetical protein